MQIYATRMFNFLRFGEKENSIVFDLSKEQKEALINGQTSMNDIYNDFAKDPIGNIAKIKERGIEGLLGIVGQIDGNPKSSNGAGKSTILEAFCYAHYGKMVRISANSDSTGEAGNMIITHINNEIPSEITEAWVEEYFESNGRVYRIKRGRALTKGRKTSSPILEFESLTEDEVISESGHRTTDTKKSIDEVNDMPYDLFVNSQMFGQNDAGKFLCGTDKVRKEMLISLLNMESVVASCLKIVRERRNKQDKTITQINETIKLLESNMLSVIRKNLPDCPSVYADCLSRDFALKMQQAIEDNTFSIQTLTAEIQLKVEEINKLSVSDVVTKVAAIKSEGLKLKAEKETLVKQKDIQMSMWKSFFEEETANLSTKKGLIVAGNKKLQEIDVQVGVLQKQVTSFDKAKFEEDISKATRAKAAKPKYEDLKQTITVETIALAEKISEIKTKLSIAESVRSKLQCQLAKIGDKDSIECLECKSLVGPSHFSSKIHEEETKIASLKASLSDLSSKSAETKAKMEDTNSKLAKISELIALESIAISEINSFQMKGQTLVSLNEKTTVIKTTVSSFEKELVEISAKIVKYTEKMAEIEKQFKSNIDAFDVKLNDLRTQLNDAQKNAESINGIIARLNSEKKSLDAKVSTTNEKNGSLKKEIEHFRAMEEQLKGKTLELSVASKLLARQEKMEEIYGLDGVQTQIVKRYLPLLNVYIKSFLDILSSGLLVVKLFVNSKSEVDVSITGGSAPIYKMLSGGEKMQIRLATDIGLALLKFVRSAKKPEIICLDEIFGPLDEVNTESVFKMLHALQDKFNRILIITHNSDIKAMIETNILVEKSSGVGGVSKIKYIS